MIEKRIQDRLDQARDHLIFMNDRCFKPNKSYMTSYEVETNIYEIIEKLNNICQVTRAVKFDLENHQGMIDFIQFITSYSPWGSSSKRVTAKTMTIVIEAVLNFLKDHKMEVLAWSVYINSAEAIQQNARHCLSLELLAAAQLVQ